MAPGARTRRDRSTTDAPSIRDPARPRIEGAFLHVRAYPQDMGDESDAPAYLAAVGVALLLGAVWVIFVPFNGLPRPVAPVAAAALAASMFAVAAAAKAADRRRTSA